MSRISEQEVRVYGVVKEATRWLTVKEVAQRADVIPRTASGLLTKLARLGIVEEARLHAGFMYRVRPAVASDEGRQHAEEIEAARQIFADHG